MLMLHTSMMADTYVKVWAVFAVIRLSASIVVVVFFSIMATTYDESHAIKEFDLLLLCIGVKGGLGLFFFLSTSYSYSSLKCRNTEKLPNTPC